MKIIETKYKGYHFRSRLEARWAVFFDELGVKWEYEPEGFELPNGKYYLPDFRVWCYGFRYYERPHWDSDNEGPIYLYIEVKGHMTPEDADKINEFKKSNPILVLGQIPDETDDYFEYFREFDNDFFEGTDIAALNFITVDGDQYPALPLATEDGHFYLGGPDYDIYKDLPRTVKAFEKARQARFEKAGINNED